MRTVLTSIRSLSRAFSALVLLSFCAQSFAFTPEKSAEKTIEESIAVIVSLLQKYPTEADTEQYIADMETLMDGLVSYPVIARRVMGDSFADASNEQKMKFLVAFKTSLIRTYSLGIRSFGGFDSKILYGKGEQNSLKNTQVFAEIYSKEGTRYPMLQSLYYSLNNNGWLIQNVVFNGVNLGITFQNQFKRNLDLAGGDVDKAIALWVSTAQEEYNKTSFTNPSATQLDESAIGDGY